MSFAHAAQVTVSDGMLYRLNPETGGVAEAGRTCRVAAAERLYWQIPGSQAVLTVRAGLRAIRIEAIRNDSGWFLSR